jgi:hypothetical protein
MQGRFGPSPVMATWADAPRPCGASETVSGQAVASAGSSLASFTPRSAVRAPRPKGRPQTVPNHEVCRLLDAGVSKAETARRLGVSRQTIYRALRRSGLYPFRDHFRGRSPTISGVGPDYSGACFAGFRGPLAVFVRVRLKESHRTPRPDCHTRPAVIP